ncbi:secreted trypsin-like serine protease [Alloactinosynnema sp. L-07]|uniref:trypsin-like serine protease n=1 Tax=Alloactinosynnema sp. L-07 TaxID=1653480 RepID=UPI00065F0A6D|nr:trypsin-like serine protease [Alloactinosynnema sp. L-07]CRK61390.1 secreted trypsin-like serine protease [Alloactinosynnema sp. L-07]
MKRTARSWGVAALAAAAVLVPLGTTIASAAETGAAANLPSANFEGATVPTDLPDASTQHYGGTPAKVTEFPGIIPGIRAGGPRPEGQTCTGTLVAPTKVLIAAHCADAAGEKTFVYGLDDLKLYNGGNGSGFQASKVVTYKKHPKYVNFDQGYDVAVVTLEKAITLVGGAAFPTYATSADASDVLIGKTGLSFGYGKKDFNDTTKDVTLTKANMPIVDGDSVCQGVGAGFKSATMICAGDPNGNPTILPGDSGGPLIVNNKIYGVASWSRADFKWYGVWGRLNNDMGDWVKQEVGTTVPADHTVSVSPASGSVKAGNYVSSTITTVAGSGGAENLKLTASGLPSGVQAVFQPTDVAAGSTAKVTFDASTSAANGTHNITLTATNAAGKAANTQYSLTVTDGGQPGPDFKVTIDPSSLTVDAGTSDRVALSTVAGSGGAEQVTLTASGAPSGVTVTFLPATVNTGEGSKVIVETAASTTSGTYSIDLNATNSGGKVAKATLTLTVKGVTNPGDHKVSVNPSSLTVNQGAGASAGVTTTAGSGGAEELTLSATGLPSGATATFQPTKVPAGEGAKVTIQTASSTPAGTYNVEVVATNAAGKTASGTVSLTVNGQNQTPFALGSAPSSVTVKQGASGSSTISSKQGSNGAEQISLTTSGAPSGVTASVSPSSIQTGASATLNLSVSGSAAAGTYTITVTGTNSAGKTATTTVSLTVETVTPPSGVTVTLSPSSGTVQQGQLAQFSARAIGGTGQLTLSSSGAPAGAFVSFNPPWLSQGGTSNVWIQPNFSTPPGTYPVTIKATSADGKTGTATYTLTVTAWGYAFGSAGRH